MMVSSYAACLLGIVVIFSCNTILSVTGHATMLDPVGPESVLTPCHGECNGGDSTWGDKWFTTGTAPGCKPTGKNCPYGGICCEDGLEPTLTSVNQLSYQVLDDGSEICKYALAGYMYNNDVNECVKDLKYRQSELDNGNISGSIFTANPWFRPGSADVVDSCGVLGGFQYTNARDFIAGPDDSFYGLIHGEGGFVNAGMPPLNMDPPAGTKGSTVLAHIMNTKMQQAQGDTVSSYPIVWTAGDIVEGSYDITANHGGGHQYRLCPLENLINDTLNESCFQDTVMEFADKTSTFVGYGKSGTSEMNITFDAMDINDENTNGVTPKGSTWRKFGISPCGGPFGQNCTVGPQFIDHTPVGFYGYGNSESTFGDVNSPALAAEFGNWKVVDKLIVPKGLNGDYVLSWRWDSEQTPQVWTQCAIITIIDPEMMLGEGDDDTGNNNDGDDDDDDDDDDKCKSLIDIVCDSKDFGNFCDALKNAKLDKEFEKESWTFFIPNDSAFENAAKVLEPLSDDDIADILMFHVVSGKILKSDDLNCKEKIEMLNGDNSRTKCNNDAIYQNGAGNNQLVFSPQIIQTDIEFCNGVAHVVDGVMFPKSNLY